MSAPARTRKRFSKAKSTTLRIILLVHRILKYQCILNDLYSGLEARDDFLHVSGKHDPAGDFCALKPFVRCENANPVAVVQMQDSGCTTSLERFSTSTP